RPADLRPRLPRRDAGFQKVPPDPTWRASRQASDPYAGGVERAYERSVRRSIEDRSDDRRVPLGDPLVVVFFNPLPQRLAPRMLARPPHRPRDVLRGRLAKFDESSESGFGPAANAYYPKSCRRVFEHFQCMG